MDLPLDPISQAWRSVWFAIGGSVIYILLDVLVLRHNSTFAGGRIPFRIGVAILALGVALGGVAWFYFSRANMTATNRVLYSSYGVRGLGLVVLVVGLARMLRKDSTPSS